MRLCVSGPMLMMAGLSCYNRGNILSGPAAVSEGVTEGLREGGEMLGVGGQEMANLKLHV